MRRKQQLVASSSLLQQQPFFPLLPISSSSSSSCHYSAGVALGGQEKEEEGVEKKRRRVCAVDSSLSKVDEDGEGVAAASLVELRKRRRRRRTTAAAAAAVPSNSGVAFALRNGFLPSVAVGNVFGSLSGGLPPSLGEVIEEVSSMEEENEGEVEEMDGLFYYADAAADDETMGASRGEEGVMGQCGGHNNGFHYYQSDHHHNLRLQSDEETGFVRGSSPFFALGSSRLTGRSSRRPFSADHEICFEKRESEGGEGRVEEEEGRGLGRIVMKKSSPPFNQQKKKSCCGLPGGAFSSSAFFPRPPPPLIAPRSPLTALRGTCLGVLLFDALPPLRLEVLSTCGDLLSFVLEPAVLLVDSFEKVGGCVRSDREGIGSARRDDGGGGGGEEKKKTSPKKKKKKR